MVILSRELFVYYFFISWVLSDLVFNFYFGVCFFRIFLVLIIVGGFFCEVDTEMSVKILLRGKGEGRK